MPPPVGRGCGPGARACIPSHAAARGGGARLESVPTAAFTMSPSPSAAPTRLPGVVSRFAAGATRLFHAYGSWLASISWVRFFLLALLLLISAGVLSGLPPFNIPIGGTPATRVVTIVHGGGASAPVPPLPPRPPSAPAGSRRTEVHGDKDVQISIDKDGIRIVRKADARADARDAERAARAAASAVASAAVAAASATAREDEDEPSVHVPSDPGAAAEVKRALEEARAAVAAAVEEARAEVRREVEAEFRDEADDAPPVRRRPVRLGDGLPEFAFLWIVASAILKIAYQGRIRAEAKAQVATETAESEQLKRQVVEARMAAMQAQVEPHFLFNTLASIDHLIESDPARASTMQKNLIALLRASMPTMREHHPAKHTLGREADVVRPYVEILKVRMEDRLQATIDIPDGLRSADFPPMVIQSLVENAIKHGLEPKAEGGTLLVKAEIVDGALAVRVADTGLGFGQAPTAGTGTGLANIRERLKLLHGDRASLVVEENRPSGTVVTVSVPYRAGERS